MKFRATVRDDVGVLHLQQAVTTFQKASRYKDCFLRLTPNNLYLSVDSSVFQDSSRLWSEIHVDKVFESFHLESRHQNNEILLAVTLEYLVRALKSALASDDVVMKLVKREGEPCLSFAISSMMSGTVIRKVTQDVPVTVCLASQIEEVQPPILPTPKVNVYLSDLRTLQHVVDRMKSICPDVQISCNGQGEMQLEVTTTMVTVKTAFKDLENARLRDQSQSSQAIPPQEFVSALIDIKHLLSFICGALLSPDGNHLLSITDNSVLLFQLDEAMTMTCLIPRKSEI
eukprot:m.75493 g.75493  ORF g.75493 m.75493 type:complete len:286 (+) comp12452_c2_seq2:161-1018(+)